MARLDEWQKIIAPLVADGAPAPAILDALLKDTNAARYLASVAARGPASHARERMLSEIRRYVRETLPAREDTARLARDLIAGRRLKREAGYQARLQKNLVREGLIDFVAPAQAMAPAKAGAGSGVGAQKTWRPANGVVPTAGTAVVVEPGVVLSTSQRIARDLEKRSIEIDPELAKLL